MKNVFPRFFARNWTNQFPFEKRRLVDKSVLIVKNSWSIFLNNSLNLFDRM